MITYKIHMLRTGATGLRENNQYVGQLDASLSEKGKKGLLQLREDYRYPNAQVVFASPLARCMQTADILYPNTQLFTKENLMDLHLGEFQGKTFAQLEDNPDFISWTQNSLVHPPQGGEEIADFNSRLKEGMEEIFQTMMEEKLTQVAVITHSGVIMTLLATLGLPHYPMHHWATANGHGFTLLFTPQMWMRDQKIEIYNHLPLPPLEDDFDLHTYDSF